MYLHLIWNIHKNVLEYLKDNKFIKMEIKVIKMWKLIKYESDKFKYFHGLRNILTFLLSYFAVGGGGGGGGGGDHGWHGGSG